MEFRDDIQCEMIKGGNNKYYEVTLKLPPYSSVSRQNP